MCLQPESHVTAFISYKYLAYQKFIFFEDRQFCWCHYSGRIFKHLRKSEKSGYLLRYVSPVCLEQLSCQWTDSHEVWYLGIFREYVDKGQVWLKYDENLGYCTCRLTYIYDSVTLNSP